jgi:hypothetical protein
MIVPGGGISATASARSPAGRSSRKAPPGEACCRASDRRIAVFRRAPVARQFARLRGLFGAAVACAWKTIGATRRPTFTKADIRLRQKWCNELSCWTHRPIVFERSDFVTAGATSKGRSCPLSLRPCRAVGRRVRVRSPRQQLFVKQWDAQAWTVRTLSEGETICESHHRFSSLRGWPRHAR